MKISGIQKFSLIDFPGKKSCIIFTAGCNFRCGFCHNPEFVLPEEVVRLKGNFIQEEALFNFLNERKGLLDGVVVSGGEPTIMPDLPEFFAKIRAMGFQTKLDSNGSNPNMLQKLIDQKLLDYIAMDIKTAPECYPDLAGANARIEAILDSIRIIKSSPIDYEFRTTLIQELHPFELLSSMAEVVGDAKHWFLQEYRPGHTLDPSFAHKKPYTPKEMRAIADQLRPVAPNIDIRTFSEAENPQMEGRLV